MNKKITSFVMASCVVVPALALTGCDFSSKPHTEHTFASEFTINETHHWHKCDECKEVNEKEEHNFMPAYIIAPETGHADGSKLVVCQDCGVSKTIAIPKNVALVTAEEWTSAIALQGVADVKIETMGTHYVVDGNKVYNTTLAGTEVYVTPQGEKFMEYRKQNGTWIKQEISEDTYLSACDVSKITSSFAGLDFNDFAYNPETKAYEALNVPGLGLSNENLVRIFFENQKLKEINVVVGSVNQVITFDYSDQTVVIPTKMATFNEWQTALSFNYENYQVATQQTVSGVESESEFKKFGNIKYVNGVAGLHQYATIENGKYYIYNESSGSWTKQEVLEPEYTEISVTATLAVFADGANFAKFTYNTESEAYEAENLVVGETTFAKIKVFIENGKAVQIYMEMSNSSVQAVSNTVFTYNSETIELPTTYETLVTPYATKQEMAAAINFLDVDKYQLVELEGDVPGSYVMKKDGDKLALFDSEQNLISAGNIEGGKYYAYERSSTWTKEEVFEEQYIMGNYASGLIEAFNLTPAEIVETLTYNPSTKAYELHDVLFDGDELDVVRFYFENLKIVKIELEAGSDKQVCAITYNNDAVELPESYVALSRSRATKQEMAAAFDFANINQFQLTILNNGVEGNFGGKRNGDTFLSYGGEEQIITNIEDGKYYLYSNDPVWSKVEVDENTYQGYNLGIAFLSEFNLSVSQIINALEYHSTYRAYIVSGTTLTFDGETVTYSKFYFEDGKLVAVDLTFAPETTNTIRFTYNNEGIDFPTFEDSQVTLSEWNAALDFSNINQYQIIAETPGGEEIDSFVVDGKIVCDGKGMGNTFDKYYTEEDGVYYCYEYKSTSNGDTIDGWERTEITEQYYVGRREALPLSQLTNQTTFEMFEHNIETGAYEVRNVQILGSPEPVDKFSLTFKDGVLIKFEMIYDTEHVVAYYTYDNINLTLPELAN